MEDSCLLLLASDSSHGPDAERNESKSAFEQIENRLEAKHWPINRHTKNQWLMTVGRRLLFYAAGSKLHSQEIVASAVIQSVLRAESESEPKALVTALTLSNVEYLPAPFNLKKRRSEVGFLLHKGRFWYTSLQGGAVVISLDD